MLGEVDWGLRGLRARAATLADPSGTLVWLAATLAAAAATGATLGKGETKIAVLPAVALVLIVMARVPAAGYVAVLWSVGTAIDMEALPQVGLSSLRFEPAEVLLGGALACLLFLPSDARRLLVTMTARRESIAMIVFLAAIFGGIGVGVSNGASLHTAALDMSLMLFYAAYWPALAALTRGRELVFRLVSAGVIVVVILQILQVVIGPGTRFFLIASADLSSSLTSDGTGFLRVRPPGLTTVYVAAGFALARVLWGPAKGRMVGWAMTAVTLSGVILSLNRNMLLGLLFGLAAAAIVAPQRHRFAVMAAALAMTLAGFVLLAQGSSLESNAIVSRVASITNYSELQTQTLDDRYYENGIALQRIRAHPIAGLGWGPDYGAMLLSSDDGFLVSQPRPFMHEQYLWIWMRAGLIGLLAIIAMLGYGIWNGARFLRARYGEEDAWLGAGVVVALVALAASSNVAIYLTPPDSIVPLVGVLALAAILRRELARR